MKKIIAVLPTMLMIAPAAFAVGTQDITVPKPQGFNFTDIGALISSIVSLGLIVAALLVFLYLVWGGIQWITSGGDKAGVESARNRITAALIGLVIVAASYAIIRLIEGFFKICIVSCTISIPSPT